MSHCFSRMLALGFIVGFMLGCGHVREHAQAAREQVSSTTKNVKKSIKKIQLHGEVDLEVMTQITAIHEAYHKYLELKNAPPSSWVELEANAMQAGTVQEARRQGAFVCFGATGDQLADETRKSDTLVAIKSANDNSIWSLQFNGDIVPMSEVDFAALPKKE
jgi:hypothetical protein